MRTRYLLFGLMIAVSMLLVAMPQPASAHAPQSVSVSYNFSTQQLTVTISHSVSNANTHYIQKVSLYRNSNLAATYNYTSQPTTNTFSYTYSISASDGDSLSAKAECNLGGSRTGSTTASAPDTSPPTVMIVSPSNGSEVTTPSITITGSASDNKGLDKVQVKVNDGTWSDATGTTSWTKGVTLAEGENTVYAKAIDTSDNEATMSVMITYNATPPPDTTPPTIMIQSPSDDSEFGMDMVTISGTSSDNEDVEKVEVRIGSGSWMEASGTVSWTISITLVEGANTVEARATDVNDNTAVDSITITYDPMLAPDTTPPVVTINAPIDGATLSQERATVSGTASDDRVIDKIDIKLNGGMWNRASGTTSWSLALNLDEGSNSIEVRATDGSGNTASESITVTYDPGEPPDTTPPVVTIQSPVDGAEVSMPEITVSGTGSDSSCLCRVESRLNDGNWVLVSGQFTWSFEVVLLSGINKVEVRAFDDSGNMGMDSIIVTYNDTLPADTTAPTIEILSPSPGSTVSDASITLTGTASDDRDIEIVEVKLNDGSWRLAPGTAEWSIDLILEPGENIISTRVFDKAGNMDEGSITITYEPPYTPGTLDGIVSDGEYRGSLSLDDGNFLAYWDFEGDVWMMALKVKTTGWISIGFDPSVAMKDSDMILGWVDDQGKVFIFDTYTTGEFGPHPPDEELGGSDDIIEFGGTEVDGWTTLEFKRIGNSSDLYDKRVFNGQIIDVIWGYSSMDEFNAYHDARGNVEDFDFSVGSGPVDDDDDDMAPDDDTTDSGDGGGSALIVIVVVIVLVLIAAGIVAAIMLTKKGKEEDTEAEEEEDT